MIKQTPLINVHIENKKVGRIALTPDHRCLFEYDPQWIQSGFSISPFYLPLKSEVFTAKPNPFNGIFGVFNDSLPDGWGQLLIDRWLISKGINPNEISILDRLSLVGNNGMGALSYQPSQFQEENIPTKNLNFYAHEVYEILNDKYSDSLNELVNKAGSSGGARPKVLVNIEGDEWLVKFKSPADPTNVGEIEYRHSLMAKKCGIEMPETCLFEGKYFGTKRFDRINNKRIHVHSAAGLLYASYRLPSLDYTSLLKATMALTRDINEVVKMFRLMVFNVLIGNKDDHAKNFAFIYKNKKWQLSPGYDLLPSLGFNGNHTTTINGNGKPSLHDCLEVAKLISLSEKIAKKIIDEVKAGIQTK